MTYIAVDKGRTWRAEEGLLSCPQVINTRAGDAPYVQMDFTDVLEDETIISSAVISEKDSQTITFGDTSSNVNATGKIVSVKISGYAAGTYVLQFLATLSTGTTQTLAKRGTMIAS